MPKKTTDRKRKYGQPTEMLAVRVPASLNAALKKNARRRKLAKSETVVAILEAAMAPTAESVFE